MFFLLNICDFSVSITQLNSDMFPYKVVGGTDVITLTKSGIYSVKGTPINTPTDNNGIAIVFSDVGSPFILYIPDVEPAIYKYKPAEKKWFKFSGIAV